MNIYIYCMNIYIYIYTYVYIYTHPKRSGKANSYLPYQTNPPLVSPCLRVGKMLRGAGKGLLSGFSPRGRWKSHQLSDIAQLYMSYKPYKKWRGERN